jgi:hypothetical protein
MEQNQQWEESDKEIQKKVEKSHEKSLLLKLEKKKILMQCLLNLIEFLSEKEKKLLFERLEMIYLDEEMKPEKMNLKKREWKK